MLVCDQLLPVLLFTRNRERHFSLLVARVFDIDFFSTRQLNVPCQFGILPALIRSEFPALAVLGIGHGPLPIAEWVCMAG